MCLWCVCATPVCVVCMCGMHVYVVYMYVALMCVFVVHMCVWCTCVCGAHVCGVHALVWICTWSNAKGWHWVFPSISLHLTYWFRFSHLNLELADWCCLMSQFASVFQCLSSKSCNYTWAGKSTKHFGFLNSSPHDCMANTLPSGSLPLSQGKLTLRFLQVDPQQKKVTSTIVMN